MIIEYEDLPERIKKLAKIVEIHPSGYIVLAQSEQDFRGKWIRINQGDRRGFYHINDFKDDTLR